jgi:hypothetical protein
MLDKKLLTYLNSAYNILHLSGYYDGERDARVVSAGFDNAYVIISRIKPEQEIPIPEDNRSASILKRFYSLFV